MPVTRLEDFDDDRSPTESWASESYVEPEPRPMDWLVVSATFLGLLLASSALVYLLLWLPRLAIRLALGADYGAGVRPGFAWFDSGAFTIAVLVGFLATVGILKSLRNGDGEREPGASVSS